MSSTSFLASARKGHGNVTSRLFKELANKVQKLYTEKIIIPNTSLKSLGRLSKGRLLLLHRLNYVKVTNAIPNFYVPIEPDHDKLTFWITANHKGLHLQDLSTFDNVSTVYDNKTFCVVDSRGLDVGYLGQYNALPSSPCWKLNGEDETAYVDDDTRLQVKSTAIGFSVTAWVKVSNFSQHNGTNRRILAKQDDTSNAYALFVTATNKACFAVKYAGTEYKVETPATLTTGQWYFIAATFKSTVTREARIYLNAVVSTTAFTPAIVYPAIDTNLQLFTNDNTGPLDNNGAFSGYVRDIRIYREQVLSATEISQFNTNKNTISNIPFRSVTIAGFTYVQSDISLTSSFTTTSYTNQSFNL